MRTRNLASAVRATLFQILQKCAALSIVFFISKVAIYFSWKIFIPSLKHLSSAKKSYIDHDDQQKINCEIRTIF